MVLNRYKQREKVFSVVMRNAEEEFREGCVSPVNLSYFLEAVAASQYKIDKVIIDSAFENIHDNIKVITMHHVCILLN